MDGRSNKAFVIAVVLHLVLFALLFTGYLLSPDDPPETTPFELYSPPSEAQAQPSESVPERREVRRMEMPEFEFEEVEVPRSEPRERPRPQQEPEPQPQSEPEPAPRPEPRPEPEPRRAEPAPEPEPERVSLSEFRARHGTPTTPRPQPPRPQPRRQVEAPQIDTSAVERLRGALDRDVELPSLDLEQLSQASAAEQSQMRTYFARLRGAIERSWSQPSSARTGMEATVQFSLSANGRITGARVVRSSGSDEFDRSILQAFERLGSFDPPPDGESYTPNLTFRVDD